MHAVRRDGKGEMAEIVGFDAEYGMYEIRSADGAARLVSMSTYDVARTVDDLDGQTVQASLMSGYFYDRPAAIRLDTSADSVFDKHPATLSPAAARKLAAELVALADVVDAEHASADV